MEHLKTCHFASNVYHSEAVPTEATCTCSSPESVGGWDEDAKKYTCSDGVHESWWISISHTPEWKAWYDHASKNMLYDVDESQECGWMSDNHARDFMKFTFEAGRNAKGSSFRLGYESGLKEGRKAGIEECSRLLRGQDASVVSYLESKRILDAISTLLK